MPAIAYAHRTISWQHKGALPPAAECTPAYNTCSQTPFAPVPRRTPASQLPQPIPVTPFSRKVHLRRRYRLLWRSPAREPAPPRKRSVRPSSRPAARAATLDGHVIMTLCLQRAHTATHTPCASSHFACTLNPKCTLTPLLARAARTCRCSSSSCSFVFNFASVKSRGRHQPPSLHLQLPRSVRALPADLLTLSRYSHAVTATMTPKTKPSPEDAREQQASEKGPRAAVGEAGQHTHGDESSHRASLAPNISTPPPLLNTDRLVPTLLAAAKLDHQPQLQSRVNSIQSVRGQDRISCRSPMNSAPVLSASSCHVWVEETKRKQASALKVNCAR